MFLSQHFAAHESKCEYYLFILPFCGPLTNHDDQQTNQQQLWQCKKSECGVYVSKMSQTHHADQPPVNFFLLILYFD